MRVEGEAAGPCGSPFDPPFAFLLTKSLAFGKASTTLSALPLSARLPASRVVWGKGR